MSFTRNAGRFAGLLYILASIPGVFALVYVPSKLIVRGNATATAHNIVVSETLFRLGIAADLICQALFSFVALALYDVLKGVNRRHALVMVTLILVSIPIALLNELNGIAALILVRGADFLSLFDKPQRDALAMLFLNLRGHGFDVAGIFWGLWLFPLGRLVYQSSFLPCILGVVLMVNCFAYPLNSFTSLVLPQYEAIVSRWMSPLQFGEVVFMLWLVIMGAKPKPLADPALNSATAASNPTGLGLKTEITRSLAKIIGVTMLQQRSWSAGVLANDSVSKFGFLKTRPHYLDSTRRAEEARRREKR